MRASLLGHSSSAKSDSVDVRPENIRASRQKAQIASDGCGLRRDHTRPAPHRSHDDPQSVLLHPVRTTRSVAGHRCDPIRNVAHFGFVADLYSAIEERRIVANEGSVYMNGTAVCRGKKGIEFAEEKAEKRSVLESRAIFTQVSEHFRSFGKSRILVFDMCVSKL